MNKTIASGLIGLIALGGGVALAAPDALAQDDTDSTTEPTEELSQEEREARFEERRAEREARRAERQAELSELLGVSTDALQAAHEAGQSLADIALEQGIDVQTVIDSLVADAQARLDEKVADGTIDAERAAEISETLVERVTARVNGERPEGLGDGFGRGRRGHRGFGPGGFGPAEESTTDGGSAADAAPADDTAVEDGADA